MKQSSLARPIVTCGLNFSLTWLAGAGAAKGAAAGAIIGGTKKDD
jgi:hypothetical protein